MTIRMYFFIAVLLGFISCHPKEQPEEEVAEVQTPVTVTSVERSPLTEYVELNATSSYLQSSFIKARANGYLQSVNIRYGQRVRAGQLAFTMKTKEAQALGNTINALDTSFRFSGMIRINALADGYVQELNHKAGDYVQEGDQLAIISDAANFGFLLNLPFELRNAVRSGQTIDLLLPDGTHVDAIVSSILPSLDSVSQTLPVMLKVKNGVSLPQNLVAKARILKSSRPDVTSVPKKAILSNESQSNFWVMKMIDSVTAIKVPVIKGMETGDRVEIIRPEFLPSDKILVSGHYGLPDTAKVKIISSVQ